MNAFAYFREGGDKSRVGDVEMGSVVGQGNSSFWAPYSPFLEVCTGFTFGEMLLVPGAD